MTISCRKDLSSAKRVVIKAGTSVVSTPEGFPSLSRMAGIVEQAAKLIREGKEVLIVSSGAIGIGRRRIAHASHQNTSCQITSSDYYSSACAAAGQLGIMALYETMFTQYDITISQLLVTAFDFTSAQRRGNITSVIADLLACGVVPILNENDAVSANQGYKMFEGASFADNDSLASLVASQVSANLLILLTDVAGVYDRPPKEPGARVIDIYSESVGFKVGEKSAQGRGGMSAKVDAALTAINNGVEAVVIAAGNEADIVEKVLSGSRTGTLFLPESKDGSLALSGEAAESRMAQINNEKIEDMATSARAAGRVLQTLQADERSHILETIARLLREQQDQIFQANEIDVSLGESSGLNEQLLARLKLTPAKLDTLVAGILAIARDADPIDQVIAQTEIAKDLILTKVSSPIGVLLVIFESRPDCLPQIASLAVRSGNALILKGGKEAEQTNRVLYSIIQEAIYLGSKMKVAKEVIGLVKTRNDIASLLELDHYIDLVIPRGSNELVSYIKSNTKIPVLGHADGVCHAYIDVSANPVKAERIVVDAKINYPSACNALECLVLHEKTVESGLAATILNALRNLGVTLLGTDDLLAAGLVDDLIANYHTEYGGLKLSVTVVESIKAAIGHINQFGSGHTECIVAEDNSAVELFLKGVDSACVFHNASTRFADGYRFGLGAEVGIATGKIHARGPVGVEGLLTVKWILRSTNGEGHTVSSFSDTSNATYLYTHKKMDVNR